MTATRISLDWSYRGSGSTRRALGHRHAVAPEYISMSDDPASAQRPMESEHRMKRIAVPQEISYCAFLASPYTSFVTVSR